MAFQKVTTTGAIEPGGGKAVDVGGTPVAVFNVDGTFYAIHNTCLHAQGSLGEGELSGTTVTCPWHGWQFDVTTGQHTMNPEICVQRFDCRLEGDQVLVSQEHVEG